MNMPLNTTAADVGPVAQARYNMIEQQIRPWDVLDLDILDLLATVRRELFVPDAHQAHAFDDLQIPLLTDTRAALSTGRCMLEPRVEARLLHDLKVQKHEKVLEIGTGSGFMAALLGHRAQRVISLEIDGGLVDRARDNLQAAGLHNVEVRLADGSSTLPVEGPFDVIVLSGSVSSVPAALLAQLKIGGRLGAIVGQPPVMRAHFVTRTAESAYTTLQPWDTIAPRLQGFGEPSRFSF